MCKIAIITQHNPSERDAIIARVWAYFSQSGENDGFGAAWLDEHGKLAYVKRRHPSLEAPPPFASSFYEDHNTAAASNGGPLIIHGRKATCGVNLENTHPMLDDKRQRGLLIHNGIVETENETLDPVTSSCDSEILLRAMLQKGTKGLEDVTGYFAFAYLRPASRKHVWSLTVVKDNVASLHVGHKSDVIAFGTTPHAVQLILNENVATWPVKDNTAMLFTAKAKPRMWSVKKGQKPAPKPTHHEPYSYAHNWPAKHTSRSSFDSVLAQNTFEERNYQLALQAMDNESP